MTRDKPMKENKIADIICTICIVIIAGITLCLAFLDFSYLCFQVFSLHHPGPLQVGIVLG